MHTVDLATEFQTRGPWVTKFVIGEKEYGGSFDPRDTRIFQFAKCFPEASEVLELGSLEGGHTFNLAQLPQVKRVVGLEGRAENLRKARFVQDLLGIRNVEFLQANLESFDLTSLGSFDAVFCSGVLYHLPQPWNLVERLAHISNKLFIWTHYAHDRDANKTLNGYQGKDYQEAGLSDPLSGLSNESFWLTLDSLTRMIASSGYPNIRILKNNPTHSGGPCVTLTATSASGETPPITWSAGFNRLRTA